MKKRIFSRILALFMALSLLSATALADVSFDDLQSVIDGTSQGTQIDGSDNLGHFWQSPGEGTEGTGYWGIESSKTDGATNITLNTDVTHTENDKTNTITIGANQDVNLDLNNNNITGTAGSDVIDVKGDLTITGGEEEGKNTISGGKTGIAVEEGGTLALDSVTVTNNDIGVSFFDDLSVTFIGTQNVVSGNKTKDISGDGKVTFKLDNKEYKVDASTADALLKNSGKVVAAGNDWLLAESNDNGYTVAYTGTSETLWGRNVLESAAKAAGKELTQITGFVVPKTVKTIGQSSFQPIKPQGLKTVIFAEGSELTTIDKWAFNGCSSLEGTIELPASVSQIGNDAFKNCSNLTGISFPDDSALTSISNGVFRGCTNLTQIKLPKKLISIGDQAFADCTSMSAIALPDTVTTIGYAAFIRWKSLTEIVLPDNLTTIGSDAFMQSGLTSVTIPANVTTIEGKAFKQCAQLKEVVFAENSKLTTIGHDVFLWSGLSGKVIIPDTVTSIGQSAFAGCPDLEEIVLPKSLKEIPNVFMANNSNTTFFEVPSTVESVHKNAFITYENSLKSVVVALEDGKTIEDVSKLIGDLRAATTKETSILNNARYCDCNLYVTSGTEGVTFYRGTISADFGHSSADASVNKTNGSVNLTSVSGTITTGDETVTLPNVAGITASIDTYGNITINVPSAITVGDEEYPDGAIVTVNPDGTIEVVPYEPPIEDDTRIVITPDFSFDAMGTGTTIEDEEVPLAGLVTLAELLEELRQYEDIEDVELPEDFQWADHEYAQAIYWGLQEALVEDSEDDPLDPDEIVTVAQLREVLENFVDYKGVDLTVTVEGEDDMIVMDLGERLVVFYGELEAAPEAKAA